MHRIFGKSKAATPSPSLNDASTSISNRTAELDKKIKTLDNELRGFKEQLKKAKGPTADHIKKRAMDVLKRKKMYENQRDQMSAQAFNVEQTAFAIDAVKDTHVTIAAMKSATKTLKFENKKIDLNDIDNMQDELEDMLEDSNEINETLGRSYGVTDDIDDADLDAELACLEDELEGDELADADSQPAYLKPSSLPVQPNNLPVTESNIPSAPAAGLTNNNNNANKVDEYGLPLNA